METTSHAIMSVPNIVPPKYPLETYAMYDETHSVPNAVDDTSGAAASKAHGSPTRKIPSMPPPPYAQYGHDIDQEVDNVNEPPTLARTLFYYGFFFFPFWLAGIYIVFSPLRPTVDWEAGKTEDEKAHLLQVLRETELRWARRCMYALLGITVSLVFIVVIIKFGILDNI